MRAPLACAMLLSSAQSINGLPAAPAFSQPSSRATQSLSDHRSLSARLKNPAARTAATRAALRMDAVESISSYLSVPDERIMKVSDAEQLEERSAVRGCHVSTPFSFRVYMLDKMQSLSSQLIV
jgi:hypothetical protein